MRVWIFPFLCQGLLFAWFDGGGNAGRGGISPGLTNVKGRADKFYVGETRSMERLVNGDVFWYEWLILL